MEVTEEEGAVKLPNGFTTKIVINRKAHRETNLEIFISLVAFRSPFLQIML